VKEKKASPQTTQAILTKSPRWKENADFPPLPPRKAETAALQEAKRLCPEVNSWALEYVKLRQITDECWCYMVCFRRTDVAFTGLPDTSLELEIPVLMNGQAIAGSTTFE
jgi:hypothetical protein